MNEGTEDAAHQDKAWREHTRTASWLWFLKQEREPAICKQLVISLEF